MTIWLAVIAGAVLGFVLAAGDFCFHSTWRRLFATPSDGSLVHAYAILLIVSTPVVQLLVAVDFIEPYVPPLAPAAALLGGLVFGAGMVIAQTCVSGMFYKLGTGMVGSVVAIAGWAAGDILTWRGPLRGLRTALNENTFDTTADDGTTEAATLVSAFGVAGFAIVILALAAAGWWVARRRTQSPTRPGGILATNMVVLGVAAAGALMLGWLLVAWHGGDYSFGTAGVPNQVYSVVVGDQGGSMWIPLALVSLIPGALVAARVQGRFWLRGESLVRYGQLGLGGLVMGVGAAIAGGCNLGHSMVGVPLLSIGSIVTTMSIVGGVFVAGRVADRVGR